MPLLITVVGVSLAMAAQAALVLFLLDLTGLGINQGGVRETGTALLINAVLLISFGAVHSLMARPGFKRWWVGLVTDRAERGVYMLVSGLTLLSVIHFWSPLPAVVWAVDNSVMSYLIYGSFAAGLFVVFWAIFSIDFLHFHGVRQAVSTQAPEPPFSVRGPYRWVRHPIQTGLIVALWSTPEMTLGHAVFAAGMTAYSLCATLILEERDLRKGLGKEYLEYAQKVPAIVPRLFAGRD